VNLMQNGSHCSAAVASTLMPFAVAARSILVMGSFASAHDTNIVKEKICKSGID